MFRREYSVISASFLFFASLLWQVNAIILDECTLVRIMYSAGVPYTDLADWACLVRGESAFNTHALNPTNADGSMDWGLFQINDRYWCDPGNGRHSANVCGISCGAMLSDDINAAVRCAMHIRRVQGFSAWVMWNNRCRGIKPNIGHCF